MKTTILSIILFITLSPTAYCAPLLANRTFQIQHIENGVKTDSRLDWLVFFKDNGEAVYQITRPPHTSVKFIRTGTWEISDGENFCTTRKDRNDYDREISTCGTLVDAGPNTYHRYNDNGELISIFIYVGDGKRF